MQLVQWIHNIANANSIMYPGYKDKLYRHTVKCFLKMAQIRNNRQDFGASHEWLTEQHLWLKYVAESPTALWRWVHADIICITESWLSSVNCEIPEQNTAQ